VARKGIPGLCVFRLTHYHTVYTATTAPPCVRHAAFHPARMLSRGGSEPTNRNGRCGFPGTSLMKSTIYENRPQLPLRFSTYYGYPHEGVFFHNRNANAQAQAGTSRLIPVMSAYSLTATPRSMNAPAR